MKLSRSWMWLLAVVLAGVFAGAGVATAQKIPADFTLDQGKDSPGKVTFSHSFHKDNGATKCTACHTKIFKMKKGATGPLSMENFKKGEQCGACHNGKTQVGGKEVFSTEDKASCERCHKK